MPERSDGIATLDEVESHLHELAPFRRFGPPEWARHDLNFGQLRLMFHLARSGPESIGGFAACVGVTPATASELIDRLERRGLVRRVRRTDDRRVVNCELTEEGTQLIAQVSGARRQALRRMLNVLTPEELGRLDGLLLTITERLEAAPPDLATAPGE